MADPAELIDRLLRGFNSAVHYMQNCGMDLERDFPEVEAGIAACVGLRAAISPAPTVPEGSVVLPKAAWDFLMGAGELDGRSFGERHPTRSGAFWWRSYITAMLAASPQPPVVEGWRDIASAPKGDSK